LGCPVVAPLSCPGGVDTSAVSDTTNGLVMRADALKRGKTRISRAPASVSMYEREDVDHFALSDA